jgi:NAD(P)-dependent dehydrogenase (short-subunit alcohol dehydrogenase family)
MQHILISGASTGIGHATTLALAQAGYHVFAGIRKEADAAKLAGPGITPILLDVASPASVAGAMADVSTRVGAEGLFAVFNNAGINLCGPFELTQEDDLRSILEVNVLGVYRLSQAALPLLQAYTAQTGKRSRILVTGSIGGAIGLPWEWAYHATKFAVTGMCQSLRFELAPLGIDVTAIMPGGVKTPIFDKSRLSMAASLVGAQSPNMAYYQKNTATFTQVADTIYKTALEPGKAAKAIVRALSGSRSPARVLIGADAKFLSFLVHALPTNWVHALLGGQMAKKV